MEPTREALIIVPTYNEVENIGALLLAIEKSVPDADVLVVDDNSPDGTQNIVAQARLKNARIHLLQREAKQGLAAAYGAGFRWGLERGYKKLVQMDADFSHPASALPVILRQLDNYSAVSGSRYIPGGSTSGWGLTRQLISRGGNVYARMVLGLPFQDLTGGFNGWRSEVLEKLDVSTLRSRGYAYQVELKYRATKAGFSLLEIPIVFENRRLGKSKMSGSIVWEAALRVLQMRGQAGSYRAN